MSPKINRLLVAHVEKHTPEGVTQRACTMLVPDAPETSTSQPTP